MTIFDLAIGAGMMNYLLSEFYLCLWLRVLSAYCYEPGFRYRYSRCVHGETPQDLEELLSQMGASAQR